MTNLETGTDFVARGAFDFPCPFCPGKVVYSKEPRAVMHTMPPCDKYVAEDPLVFLRNARVKAVGRMPDDDEWPIPPPGGREKAN